MNVQKPEKSRTRRLQRRMKTIFDDDEDEYSSATSSKTKVSSGRNLRKRNEVTKKPTPKSISDDELPAEVIAATSKGLRQRQSKFSYKEESEGEEENSEDEEQEEQEEESEDEENESASLDEESEEEPSARRSGRSQQSQQVTRKTQTNRRTRTILNGNDEAPAEEGDEQNPEEDAEMEESTPAAAKEELKPKIDIDAIIEEVEKQIADAEAHPEKYHIEHEEDQPIEKILAYRDKHHRLKHEGLEVVESQETAGEDDVLEYLVKYKERSYVHCKWVPASVIERQHMGRTRLNKFHQKFSIQSFEDGEYFNPDYLAIDRVISHDIIDGKYHFLVKWKALGYEEITWEQAHIVNDTPKIRRYFEVNEKPALSEFEIPKRPNPKSFNRLEISPEFKNSNQLREYQLEGLNWLVFCWYNRRNSILADEM